MLLLRCVGYKFHFSRILGGSYRLKFEIQLLFIAVPILPPPPQVSCSPSWAVTCYVVEVGLAVLGS